MIYPVLILAFNRPRCFTLALESIVRQGERQVYVSLDGAREEFPNEIDETLAQIELSKARGLITSSQVLSKNFGVLEGVQQGISWYFSQISHGFIIEDDLVLQEGALLEADFAMDHLRLNPEIASVNLRNIVPLDAINHASATFRISHLTTSHGWGTSAHFWSQSLSDQGDVYSFKFFLKLWKHYGFTNGIAWLIKIRREIFLSKKSPKLGVWDIRWTIAHARFEWKSIFLNRNRILYDGWSPEATNTKEKPPDVEEIYMFGEELTLLQPETCQVDKIADRYLSRQGLRIGLFRHFRNKFALRTRARKFLARINE